MAFQNPKASRSGDSKWGVHCLASFQSKTQTRRSAFAFQGPDFVIYARKNKIPQSHPVAEIFKLQMVAYLFLGTFGLFWMNHYNNLKASETAELFHAHKVPT